MELLTPLDTYLLKHPMDEREAIQMGLDLTSALSYCHKEGVIHRDIKPANIFVTETGIFKLGDFGIARTIEKTTGGLSKKGTESYMAPEVYLVRPYGKSVDQYSLGMVLYSCMNNNRLPFLPPYPEAIKFSQREEATARRMRGEELPKPVNASEEFSNVILRACNYDPKRRYNNVDEFHEALNALVPKEVEKTPPPFTKKKFDFNQIPKWAWYAGAGVICLIAFITTLINRTPVTNTEETVVEEESIVEEEPVAEERSKTDEEYEKEFEKIIGPFLEKMCYVNGDNWETASMEEIGKSIEGDFTFRDDHYEHHEAYTYTTNDENDCHYMYADNQEDDAHIKAREMDFDLNNQWVMVETEWRVDSDSSDETISLINKHFPDAGFRMNDPKDDVFEAIVLTDDMFEWLMEKGDDGIDWKDENDIFYSISYKYYDNRSTLHFYRDGRSMWASFRTSGELYEFHMNYDYMSTSGD